MSSYLGSEGSFSNIFFFRAEQINQMLEICNQMKLMGFNVYAHLMASANPHQTSNQRKNSYKKQDKNGEKNSTVSWHGCGLRK